MMCVAKSYFQTYVTSTKAKVRFLDKSLIAYSADTSETQRRNGYLAMTVMSYT